MSGLFELLGEVLWAVLGWGFLLVLVMVLCTPFYLVSAFFHDKPYFHALGEMYGDCIHQFSSNRWYFWN